MSRADSKKTESHLKSSWELEGVLDELLSDLDEAMANKAPITSDNKPRTHVFFFSVLYRILQKNDQDDRLGHAGTETRWLEFIHVCAQCS